MNAHRSVRLPAVAIAAAAGIWLGGHAVWAADMAPWIAVAASSWLALRRRPRVRTLVAVALLAAALGARARAPQPPPVGEVVVDDRAADVIEGWVSGPITATRRGIAFELDQGGARVRVTAERAAVLPGDRVRVTGRVMTARGARNPGAMDRVAFAQARGMPWEVYAQRLEVVAVADRISAWRWPAAYARDASARVAARGGDREGNALVRAAVLGDRSALDDETDAAWRAAGVYHALSVSGLHLAAVALVAFVGVGWLWALSGLGARIAPRRAAAAFALPLSIAYTLVTGAQIATVRAMVVVGVMLVGELLGRHARASDALGLAALVVLLLSPLALHDPGFQLSFVAATTLVIAAGQGGHFVVRALRTSLAVSLATAPITAWHFHEIAIGGVIGNLVATPLVELVTIPIGLAGLVLGGAVIDLAVAIAGLTAAIVAWLGALTPSVLVPPPSPLELVACAALYAAWGAARLGWLARRHALAGAAVAALALSASWAARAHDRVTDDTLRITFLDVGQGDAAVIELPGGAVWLVDAGGSPGGAADELRVSARPGEEIARFLRARRITAIDVAVVSHPHPDHYLGLAALAPRIPIRTLWSAAEDDGGGDGAAAEAGAFSDLAAWLVRGGTASAHPALGPHVVGDVVVRVWGPIYDPGYGARSAATADPVRSVNDNSLVLTVERAGRCVLFTGDLEEEGEAALVAARVGRCDVVKVPHHGSSTSSSPGLVDATRPDWAVISLGRGNRFGFPAPAVVARWEAAGAGVLRTDTAGAITVTIDRAGTLQVATFD
jgi:competence protein ComEC